MSLLSPTPPSFRYSTALVAIHWFMALLLVAVYASIELRVLFPKGSEPRELIKTLHFLLGLGVLLMVALRLAARVSSPQPPPTSPPGRDVWMERVAAAGHASLYLLMASMPVLGWLSLSAAGKPIAFFGLQLPALMAADKTWAHDLKAMHETLGTVGYWLIGSHVMAALGHQWLLKDGLLNRMALGRQAAAG